MMTRRALGVLAALVGVAGCGDDGTKLRIQPFEQNRIELQVNQAYNLTIRLSTKVNDKTYVLGDATVSGGGDNFYRRVFSTTVKLRNPSNRIFLQLDA